MNLIRINVQPNWNLCINPMGWHVISEILGWLGKYNEGYELTIEIFYFPF